MKFIFSTLKKTLFWSYERGSWQYDVMVLLILAFIFLAPNRVFHSHRSATADESSVTAIVVRSDELGAVPPGHLKDAIENYLSNRYGHPMSISTKIDQLTDDSGRSVYLVREK
jgi:hypothetical protein